MELTLEQKTALINQILKALNQEIDKKLEQVFIPINQTIPMLQNGLQKMNEKINSLNVSDANPNLLAFLKKVHHYDPEKDYSK